MTIFSYALYKLGYLFVCQVGTKENGRSSTGSHKTLAKKIPEFHEKGKIGFHFVRISSASSDLLSILTTNKAVYHHNRFSKYSDSKLKSFNEPSKKRKSAEEENGKKSARVSAESRERFNLFCY